VNAGNSVAFINPTWTGIAGSSVVITFSGDPTFTNGGPTIDNIQFTQTPVAAVPVPGAFALMVAGLGVLGVTAKRRHSR
jgi:precorrin-6B methylase 1